MYDTHTHMRRNTTLVLCNTMLKSRQLIKSVFTQIYMDRFASQDQSGIYIFKPTNRSKFYLYYAYYVFMFVSVFARE